MVKKLGLLCAVLAICTLNNGCDHKHQELNAKEIYINYLKSRIKK